MDEILLHDDGPLYRETDLNSFIVEPFNTISAAIFIVIALYWLFKLKGRYNSFPFLSFSTYLLSIGAVGGTIYHGFRIHSFFMYMDWLPILIICMAASVYLLYRLSRSVWKTALWMVGLVLFQVINFSSVPDWLSTNLSYAALGLTLLIPLLFVLVRTKFKYWGFVVASLLFFGAALFFRLSDRWIDIAIGTHFLWHLFGAMACHSMFMYMYKFRKSFPRFELIARIRESRLRLPKIKRVHA